MTKTKTAPIAIGNTALEILNRENVPSAALAAARDQAREAQRIATDETAAAESAYRASLLLPTATASFEAKTRLDAAVVERDRAAALVDELTRRHDVAIEDEKEAARRLAYDKAASEVATVQKRLLLEYPKAAAQIASILEDCRTAELQIMVINRNLPRDAEPLRWPDDCRNVAAQPEEIVSKRARSVPCFVRSDKPDFYNPVEENEIANIRGSFLVTSYGQTYPVAWLEFDEITKRPAMPAAHAPPLHLDVMLPGATARDLPIWDGKAQPRFDRNGDELESGPGAGLETVLVRRK
ncbi:MAG: hypothetical protein JWM36_3215 [Hyphomicrobiales bacterium]|nr:hypothetical protein [Hyphomicrobiales bacterium]